MFRSGRGIGINFLGPTQCTLNGLTQGTLFFVNRWILSELPCHQGTADMISEMIMLFSLVSVVGVRAGLKADRCPTVFNKFSRDQWTTPGKNVEVQTQKRVSAFLMLLSYFVFCLRHIKVSLVNIEYREKKLMISNDDFQG